MKENRSVLTFDGIDDYILADRQPNYKNLKTLTMEAWVKVAPGGNDTEFAGIFSNLVDNDAEESGYALCLNGYGGVYFELKPSESGEPLRVVPNEDSDQFLEDVLPEGEWHHVAGVYDGANMIVYIDGEERAREALVTDHVLCDPENDLHIGATKDVDEFTGFNGQIAQVSLWNTPRSQAEVQKDMHNRLQGNEPGLVAYWPMDEGKGEAVEDLANPGQQTGSVHGGAQWIDTEVDFPETMRKDGDAPDTGGTGTEAGETGTTSTTETGTTTTGTTTTGSTTTTTEGGTTTTTTTTTTSGTTSTTTGGGSSTTAPSGSTGAVTSHWTSTALTAATQHLNRKSVTALLEQIVSEIDDHCKLMGEYDSKLDNQRKELLDLIDGLKNTNKSQDDQIDALKKALTTLTNNFNTFKTTSETNTTTIVNKLLKDKQPEILDKIKEDLDKVIDDKVAQQMDSDKLRELREQLDKMKELLATVKQAATELDEGEIQKTKEIITKMIEHLDLGPMLENSTMNVNGSDFNLKKLLELLAGGPKVASVHMGYDDQDLRSATFILTDGTVVNFGANQVVGPSGLIHYVFETDNWKGVPAAFSLGFSKTTVEMTMCKKTIHLDGYDVAYETNVVFDLGPNGERNARTITAP